MQMQYIFRKECVHWRHYVSKMQEKCLKNRNKLGFGKLGFPVHLSSRYQVRILLQRMKLLILKGMMKLFKPHIILPLNLQLSLFALCLLEKLRRRAPFATKSLKVYVLFHVQHLADIFIQQGVLVRDGVKCCIFHLKNYHLQVEHDFKTYRHRNISSEIN